MRYLKWGSTGLRVSELALGTVELGLDYGIAAAGEVLRPTGEEAERLLHRALDLGINVIDTARAYGDAEELIGRALAGRRHEFVLVTKTASDRVAESIAESLRLLRTGHVDVLMLHCKAGEVPVRSQELEQVLERGQARFLGASVYGTIVPVGFDCVQLAWNPLDRRAAPLDYRGAGLMARSVLMRGALTHRHQHLPESLALVRRAIEQLEQFGIPLPELAYRYVLSQPRPLTALVGTGRLNELEACCECASRGPLAPEILNALARVECDEALLDLSRWPAF